MHIQQDLSPCPQRGSAGSLSGWGADCCSPGDAGSMSPLPHACLVQVPAAPEQSCHCRELLDHQKCHRVVAVWTNLCLKQVQHSP